MWKYYFDQIVSALNDPIDERFFKLISWGEYGAYSQLWKKSFSQLGILHLLVLSGSQMTLLIRAQSNFYLLCTQAYFLKALRPFLPLFLFFSSFYYLKANQMAPPLLRAFLFFWTESLLKLIAKDVWSAPLTFIFHLILAPEQVKTMSFILSWITFSFLLFLEKIETSRWKTLIYISLLSQIVVIVLTHEVSFGVWGTLKLLIANLIFAYLFDNYLSFVLSILLSTSFFIMILPNIVSDGLLAVLKSLFPIIGKGLMILIHLARNTLLWV